MLKKTLFVAAFVLLGVLASFVVRMDAAPPPAPAAEPMTCIEARTEALALGVAVYGAEAVKNDPAGYFSFASTVADFLGCAQ